MIYFIFSDVSYFRMAYGLCWEPVLSQLTQLLEYINKPSCDPSPPLPFWDKARLLYHGRLTLSVDKLSIILHASLDPYNMIEEMEILWTALYLDWTNGKIFFPDPVQSVLAVNPLSTGLAFL